MMAVFTFSFCLICFAMFHSRGSHSVKEAAVSV